MWGFPPIQLLKWYMKTKQMINLSRVFATCFGVQDQAFSYQY